MAARRTSVHRLGTGDQFPLESSLRAPGPCARAALLADRNFVPGADGESGPNLELTSMQACASGQEPHGTTELALRRDSLPCGALA
jgi:hypothetical protein